MNTAKDPIIRLQQVERSREILEVARRLFVENGYEKTSLDMIISQTGGSRRNIYDLFGNKEGLFDAVMKYQLRSVLAQTHIPKETDATQSVQSQLEAIGIDFLTGLLRPVVLRTLRQFIVATDNRSDLGQQAYDAGPAVLYERLESYFSVLAREGRLEIRDIGAASRMFVEMLKGGIELKAMMTGNYEVQESEIQSHVQEAVHLFLHGTLPR